jgi:hypothetical protein
MVHEVSMKFVAAPQQETAAAVMLSRFRALTGDGYWTQSRQQ